MILKCNKQIKSVERNTTKKKQNLVTKNLIYKDIKDLMGLQNQKKALKTPRDTKGMKKNLLECIKGLSL